MSQTPVSLHSVHQAQILSRGNFEGRKESHFPTPQLCRESPRCGPPPLWHHHPGHGVGTPTPPGATATAGRAYLAALIYCSQQKGTVPSRACLVLGAFCDPAVHRGRCAASCSRLPGVGRGSRPVLQRQEKAGQIDLTVLTEI